MVIYNMYVICGSEKVNQWSTVGNCRKFTIGFAFRSGQDFL